MTDADRWPGAQDPEPTSENPDDWPTGRLLFTVARRIEKDWNAHLAAWDLNHAGHPALLHLLNGPLTQREIAVRNGVTEQTMSRIVARLERSGYVTRDDDPRDRRRRAVSITDLGRRVALEAAQLAPAEDLTSRGLDAAQVEQFRTLLIAMVRAQHDSGDGAGDES